MLPAAARLTSGDEFRSVVRRGRRAGRPRLVVHALFPHGEPREGPSAESGGDAPRGDTPASEVSSTPTRGSVTNAPARVGFVVSKAVGNAVVRHRVTRRLRHLMRDRLPWLPAGTLVVVRALKPAAEASSAELGADLDAALRKVRTRGHGGRHRNHRRADAETRTGTDESTPERGDAGARPGTTAGCGT
ncbi:ribonuclease P protein component [Bounagaea algeriensis]